MAEYRVHIRKGDIEVEVESSDKAFVESKLKGFASMLGVETGAPATAPGKPVAKNSAGAGKAASLVEHVKAIVPKGGTQTVVAIGHYLETYGGKSSGFKTRDISEGFKKTKFKHSNPAEAVRQAKQQGFLMDGSEPHTSQLTQTAEDWVKGQLAGE